jgi:hypothetical protein
VETIDGQEYILNRDEGIYWRRNDNSDVFFARWIDDPSFEFICSWYVGKKYTGNLHICDENGNVLTIIKSESEGGYFGRSDWYRAYQFALSLVKIPEGLI